MTPNKITFVTFKPQNDRFIGFISIGAVINNNYDMEYLLRKSSTLYMRHIKKLRYLINEIQGMRTKRQQIAARKIWEIGDIIFKLRLELQKLSLELDGLYDHLVRDLEVKRKWLEKVIIFRRYIPDKKQIPKSLNWGRCEKGTRRIAQKLIKGLPIIDSK